MRPAEPSDHLRTRFRCAGSVAGVLVFGALVAAAVPVGPLWAQAGTTSTAPRAEGAEASVTVHLAGVEPEVAIVSAPDGSLRFLLESDDGEVRLLTPEQFARRVYEEQSGRPWWKRVLNITSLAGVLWVGLGFLGQVVFTARMLVQWIASERRRRSVVPIAFWWLSLVGASMLLVYFIWRKDIVGVLGQATGWIIYLRNLRLLYAERQAAQRVPA